MNLINYCLELFSHMGYTGIVFLMALESSIFPIPSEVIIPPAAILASRGEMNLLLVILMGVIGSILGAVGSYFVADYLGRAIVYKLADHKIAKSIMISSEKVKKAEQFFLKYGAASVFFGRLLPVIRHLISLPAGFCKMPFWPFVLYTALGSTIWVTILAVASYYFGLKVEVVAEHFKQIVEVFMVLCLIGVIIFWLRKKKKQP